MSNTGGDLDFGEFGNFIWDDARKADKIGFEILSYFYQPHNDRALIVMVDKVKHDMYENYGAYHCLCGLGYLTPYIDKEGMECAKLTQLGRDAVRRYREEVKR